MTVGPTDVLKAPFPYPGGKSRVAHLVWERFGNVDNLIEPFMGSLAVLLRRPADHFRGGYRVETCNDVNHYLVNFWRAVRADPEKVAEFADWPVTEADLHARHKWLVRSAEAKAFRQRMAADPDHFDAKVAGWWVWGACCWIGGAWCSHKVDQAVMPLLDPSQKGVHGGRGESPTDWVQPPDLTSSKSGGVGVHRRPGSDGLPDLAGGQVGDPAADAWPAQRPELSNGDKYVGRGVHGRPQLADAYDVGRVVNGGGNPHRKRPNISGTHDTGGALVIGVLSNLAAGTCDARRAWLTAWMRRLSDRLRLVRTCYGHWARVCDSDSTLTRLGLTGVFLDPPYPARRADTGAKSRDPNLYASDRTQDLDALRDEVLDWCRRRGADPMVRVAVCCYEGDGYEPLAADGWAVVEWEAGGGYANQRRKGKGKAENARRERLYFSPACLDPAEPNLFSGCEGG